MMKLSIYLIIGAFLVGILVTFVDRGFVDAIKMNNNLLALREANFTLAKENGELAKKISLLKNDLSYIEMIARNELGMVKEGDLVFQFEK